MRVSYRDCFHASIVVLLGFLSNSALGAVYTAPVTAQAEDFSTKASVGSTFSESGNVVYAIWANGAISNAFYFPKQGTYRFTVNARASLLNGLGAKLVVRLNDVDKASVTVSSTSLKDYAMDIKVTTPGQYKVSLAFTNDASNSSGDRNLILNSVRVVNVSSPTGSPSPSPTPVPQPSPSPSPAPAPSPNVNANHYYVSPSGDDADDGSQAKPWRTIKKADASISVGSKPVIVHVAPGQYGGGFTTTKNGLANARITFLSDTTWGAKIVGTGGSTAESGWFSKGNYVDIIGFEIDGSQGAAASWCTGIYVGGGNSTVQNAKVHNVCQDPTTFANNSGGNGGAGILLDGWYGGLNNSAINNLVYAIGPSNQSSSLIHGIYQSTSGSVINNVVYNVVGDGITSWHDVHDVNIVNNTVYKARGVGIVVGSGDSGAYGGGLSSRAGDYFSVNNNIVVGCKEGIIEFGQVGSHNTYLNNLVYNNGSQNLSIQGGGSASGTVSSDPKFVNASGGDLRLSAGSPAINSGTTKLAPARDFDGVARPSGGAVDIGAFEAH